MIAPKERLLAPYGDGARSLQEAVHDLEKLGLNPEQINIIKKQVEKLRGYLAAVIQQEDHPLFKSSIFERLHPEHYLGIGIIVPQNCERNPDDPQRYWTELYTALSLALWKDISLAVKEGSLSLTRQQPAALEQKTGSSASKTKLPELVV